MRTCSIKPPFHFDKKHNMKVSLISLLAILAISQAHIIEKRDEESDRVEAAEDACYQNECKALHDKFFNECTTYESNDTMDSKYYNCTCDALKNVSDSCKKCMTNTGMLHSINFNSLLIIL